MISNTEAIYFITVSSQLNFCRNPSVIYYKKYKTGRNPTVIYQNKYKIGSHYSQEQEILPEFSEVPYH